MASGLTIIPAAHSASPIVPLGYKQTYKLLHVETAAGILITYLMKERGLCL